jgi:predicted PurR-regulated permease PerM
MRDLLHKLKNMEAILTNGLNWLTKHVPAPAFIILLMTGIIGVTIVISNFVHSVAEIRHDLNEINTQELPAMRAETQELKKEMNKQFSEMDKRFSAIDERLDRIELRLNTTVTYIENKEGIKPRFP